MSRLEEKFERLIWRWREKHPGKGRLHNNDLRKLIEQTIGYDIRTIKGFRALMIRHKIIKSEGKHHVRLLLDNSQIQDLTGFKVPEREKADDDKDDEDIVVVTSEPECLYHNGAGPGGICSNCGKF